MNEVWYLIDTNVLSKLTPAQRASTFMQGCCRIPSEILYETSGFPDIAMLRELEYPVSPEILDLVREVMKTVPPGDFKLVDLYRAKGNGDPILIATALDGIRAAEQTLFEQDWKIVTDDAAVRSKAFEFEIGTLSSKRFVVMLDA